MTARRPLIIAHRGFSAKFPENTLAAVHGAIGLGVEFVEIDVQETRDGKLVVFHDYRLNRICHVRGQVRELTLAQMQRLNPAIPSLREVLCACRGKARLLIEIKGADPRKVAEEILRQGMDREVIVFSLSAKKMQTLAVEYPHLRRFGLVARNLKLRIRQLKSVEGVALSRRLVRRREVVEEVRRRGWKLFVWTVNREAEMRRLATWGVDGLITNHPDYALEL